eukprot:gene2396-2700_t
MAAATAFSTGRKAALAGGGLLVAGYGLNYFSTATKVAALQKDKGDIETKIFVAQGRYRRAESSILESESLIKALQEQKELDSKSMNEIKAQLEEARLKVQQLEAQQQHKQNDIHRMGSDLHKVQLQLEQARVDVEKFRKESALAEKALQAANDQVAAAKKQYNPLNHPALRGLLGRKNS